MAAAIYVWVNCPTAKQLPPLNFVFSIDLRAKVCLVMLPKYFGVFVSANYP